MPEKGHADGYFFFLIFNAVMYLAAMYVLVFWHKKDAQKANHEKEIQSLIYRSEHQ